MKNILLITLLTCLYPTLIFAQSTDNSAIARLNQIYVAEVTNGGDEGAGVTVEFSIILDETDNIFQTIGLEVGYITSEKEEFGIEWETSVVPFLFNYTTSGEINGSDFVWEAGTGIGVYFIDADLNSDFSEKEDDNDVILGGQLFGSLGYKFDESLSLLAGVRYLFAEDADLFDIEDEVLNSVAFDLSLNFVF